MLPSVFDKVAVSSRHAAASIRNAEIGGLLTVVEASMAAASLCADSALEEVRDQLSVTVQLPCKDRRSRLVSAAWMLVQDVGIETSNIDLDIASHLFRLAAEQ